MAVNWRSENSTLAVDSVKRRVLPACLVCVLVIVAVNLLAGWLTDSKTEKVAANQIVSPWDKKQVPPTLHASHVVVKRQSVEPQRAATPEKRPEIRHKRVRRYHARRHVEHSTTWERSTGYL